MSFYEEKKGNSIQEYLQIGREQRFYLRNKNNPESVNVENILAAIKALRTKHIDSFHEKENYLLSMLSPKDRDLYIIEDIENLRQLEKKYISSLSDPELKRQYSGDRTKVRLGNKIQKHTKDKQFEKLCNEILDIDLRVISVYILDQKGEIVESGTRSGFEDIVPKKGPYLNAAIQETISYNFEHGGAMFGTLFSADFVQVSFPLQYYYLLVISKLPIDVLPLAVRIEELIKQEVNNLFQKSTEANKKQLHVKNKSEN